MDQRDIAVHGRGDGLKFNEASMTFVDSWLEDGEEDQIGTLPAIFKVCSTCDGKGSHVNPSIDAHGLSAEDFAEDPDFALLYFSGAYDQRCNECSGRRVSPEVDWDSVGDEQTKKACAELDFRAEQHLISIREKEIGF